MGRQLNHSYPTVLSDVTTAPMTYRGVTRTSVVSYSITNCMRVPAFWRDSQGVLAIEPAANMMSGNEVFAVTIKYEINPGAAIDTRELLREIGDPSKHVERKQIHEVLTRLEAEANRGYAKTFSYTVGITYDELMAHGGVVYLNDVDLVVGLSEYADMTHPYSTQGQVERVSESLPIRGGAQQQILLVDNTGLHHTRWLNTGQRVMELKAQRDPSLNDGVYVTYTDGRNPKPTTVYYPLEKAEKELGVYLSFGEAKTYGSPDDQHKQNLKELEQQAQAEKAEAARLKAIYERESLEHKERVKQEEERLQREKELRDRDWQHQRDDMDRQRQRMQLEKERFTYEMEMSKFERKDASDGMKSALDIGKAIIGVVSLCLSLYLAIQKSTK